MLRRTLSILALSFAVVLLCGVLRGEDLPPTLAIGSPAPDFCLPGIDGATHCLQDYASAKVLVVIFTCNHCPTAQLYETRIKQLVDDYKGQSVAFVAIQPNNPKAVQLDELGYTDLSDSFAEMKIRAAYRHFNFPYLYDGETQSVSRAYGPVATPHVYVFGPERKLLYDGRIDNNPRPQYVTRQDARIAIDEVLAGKPVEVPVTAAVGCSTKWMYKEAASDEEMNRIKSQPVSVKPALAADLSALRKNSTGKLLLVDFWATWCGPCVRELPLFQTMYRMYGHRPFQLVTVSINYPDEKTGVLRELEDQHATSENLIFGAPQIYDLMAAFNPKWKGAVPYTVLISPKGEVLYERQGPIDALELRRLIIANLPDDDYIGHTAYWHEAVYPQ
jgi:thiol-disulfide isomerase/thioredoxin